jgi:hypothetical protein
LFPGQTDRVNVGFPAAAVRLRVRLLYRRFWQPVADAKGWPDNEIVLADRALNVAPR